MRFSRRDLLRTGAALGGAGLVGRLDWAKAWAADQPFQPEKGAKLRFLRWGKFLDAEDQATTANIRAFTQATGVEVQIDNVWQDDVQTKAALAANINSGPDIIWALHTTPHLFPDKLVDVTDVADYLGKKYGGWYPIIEEYGKRDGRWIAIPSVVVGVLPNYRISWMKQAGFEKFPSDTDGFLKLCQGLKKIGHPAGFCLGKSPNDAATFCHWMLWAFGGKTVDADGNVVINSPQTEQALEYSRALYDTFISGTISWNDSSNNKAFLAGEISLTNNSVSIYGKALQDKMEIAADIDHAYWPVGPVGRSTEMHLLYPLMTFRYTKFPNAAKAFVAFMMEKPQYDAVLERSIGYLTQSLKGFENNPVWDKDPKTRPFRDVTARAQSIGYAGPLGYAAAGVLGDFVLSDMFAEVASGSTPAKEAMKKAEQRIQRYYKV